MILESLVTTTNTDGSPHVAPMGALVHKQLTRLTLRPYATSATYRNLRRTPTGVLHVTDNVELIAQAAVGQLSPPPRYLPGAWPPGHVLADACRWYAFQVESLSNEAGRNKAVCRIVEQDRLRDFFGLSRAKHAVIEAAILASRTEFLPADQIRAELARLRPLVEKTAGPQETRAFEFLEKYLEQVWMSAAASPDAQKTGK